MCAKKVRDDFAPVVAEVQLHKPAAIYDDNRSTGKWFQYAGALWTLPVTYLCPRHAGLVELPLRMAWPTDASSVTPKDVIG